MLPLQTCVLNPEKLKEQFKALHKCFDAVLWKFQISGDSPKLKQINLTVKEETSSNINLALNQPTLSNFM